MSKNANSSDPPRRKRRGFFRKLLLTGVILLVLLVAGVGFFGPAIAASIAPGIIEARANNVLEGSVEIGTMRLSWSGPQVVESFELRDPDGMTAVQGELRLTRSLISLLRQPTVLDTVELQGTIDLRTDATGATNIQRAVMTRDRAGQATQAPPTPAAGSTAPAEPIRLPKNLLIAVDLGASTIRLSPDGLAGDPIAFDNVTGSLRLDRAGDVAITFSGMPNRSSLPVKPVTLEITGQGLTQADGALSLDSAQVDARFYADLPQAHAAAISSLMTGQPMRAVDAVASTMDARRRSGLLIDASLAMRDGRLGLADPKKPATLDGRVPAPLLRPLLAAADGLRLNGRPSATLALEELNIPVPSDPSGPLDLRSASFQLALDLSEIDAVITDEQTGAEERIVLQPRALRLGSRDLADRIGLSGGAGITLNGQHAGDLGIDLVASGLLRDTGSIAGGMPRELRGSIEMRDAPSALLQPLVTDLGVNVDEAIGPALTASVQLSARAEEGDAIPASSGQIPSTSMRLHASAEHLIVQGVLELVNGRLTTASEGVRITSRRPARLVGNALEDSGITLIGDGMGVLSLRDLDVPFESGMPNLQNAAATASLILTKFSVTSEAGPTPIMINEATTTLALDRNQSVVVEIDWNASHGGRALTGTGGLTLNELLSFQGDPPSRPNFTPATVRPSGRITLAGIPTWLSGLVSEQLPPWMNEAIGPAMDLTLTARPSEAGRSEISLGMVADRASADGAFLVSKDAIELSERGLVATFNEPGLVLNRVLATPGESAAAQFSGGSAQLSARNLRIPMGDEQSLLPLAGEARFEASGLLARLDGENARTEQLSINRLTAHLALQQDGGARIKLDGSGQREGEDFSLTGDLALKQPKSIDALADMAALSPRGTIALADLPTELLSLAEAEYGPLAGELIGRGLSLEVEARTEAENTILATFALRGDQLESRGNVALQPDHLAVSAWTAEGTLTPRALDRTLAVIDTQLDPMPSLGAPAPYQINLSPIALSRQPDGQWTTDDTLTVQLKLPEDLVLRDVYRLNEQSTLSIGLRKVDLRVGATQPMSESRSARVTLDAEAFNPAVPAEQMATVKAQGQVLPVPSGFDIDLRAGRAEAIDQWLGRPDLLALATGSPIVMTGRIEAQSPSGDQPINVTIDTARLDADVALVQRDEGLSLLRPAQVDWSMPAAWGNSYLLAVEQESKRRIGFSEPTRMSLTLADFAIGPFDRPLAPERFKLDARFTSPALALKTDTNESIRVVNVTGSLTSTDKAGRLAFSFSGDRDPALAQSGEEQLPGPQLIGTISGLADSTGVLTTQQAALDSKITGDVPTIFVDALAQQNGALVDLFGPDFVVNGTTTNLSRQSGHLAAEMRTTNATGRINARVADDRIIVDGPTSVSLFRISNQTSKRYFETIIPIINNFEKTDQNKPSVMTARELIVPMDNDLSKLNGVIDIDLGSVNFQASTFFSRILKATHNRAFGELGKNIDPFTLTIKQGVASYPRVKFPTGEFTFETRGRVDLVKQEMDVIVYLPASALTDELAAALRGVPLVNDTVQVPVRFKGGLANPKPEIAFDLFVDEGLPNLIDKSVGGLLNDLFNKDKDKKK